MISTTSLLRVICTCAAVHSTALSQTILRSVDFEDYATGPGELEGPYNGVAFFSVAGNAFTDPFQGVVDSSPIGTGKAGYLGGPSLASGSPFFNFLHFPGNFQDPFYIASGTSRALVSKTIDFAIVRNASSISSSHTFYSVSATLANGEGFASHALVSISSDNRIEIRNNWNQMPFDSGVSVTPGTAYTLSFSLDYNQLVWSASLRDKATDELFILANERPLESDGFTIGDYTKVEELNSEIFALFYDVETSQVLDVLFIDNFTATAIPEPGSSAIAGGLVALSLVALKRRRFVRKG